MGTVDGITYGERIWHSDPDAAFAEADRRVAMVREDPDRKRLFLSDLYALRRLPPDLATCSRLEAILIGDATGPDDEDYSHPGTRMLDDWSPLLDLTGLKELDVSWSNFSQWDWLAGLPALQHLDCGSTRITSLEVLAGLPALQHLDCARTQIASLAGLAGLPALQHLDCGGTQIDSLEGLAGLPALQHLNCMSTQIDSLEVLAGLPALQHLNCAGTQITSLAPLADLPALQHLDCARTQITSLEVLAGLPALQHLICYSTQIASLEVLAGLPALRHLNCAFTQIASLEVLAGLPALQHLDCGGTRITSLEGLAGLPALQHLSCRSTQIDSLEVLAGLPALQHLNCAQTQIDSLEGLAGLPALQHLSCSSTQITSLEVLADLPALQHLDCAHTQIDSLEGLADLPALQELRIDETELSDLTPVLELGRPIRLMAHRAQIRGLPGEVLSGNLIDDCFDRFKAHVDDLGAGPVELNDVKLMVLGNGRIGKTQIVNRLRGRDFEENADSTHGVIVAAERIDEVRGEPTFNIWDFGGQDIYHGTHALFLRSRAIFLVVWSKGAEGEDTHSHGGMTFRNRPLSWWLDYVRRYGSGTSPLIVVQNKMDIDGDLGEPEAARALRNDIKFCRVQAYSAADRDGHGTLLDNLGQAVRQFNPPLIGRSRLSVIERLRSWRAEDEPRPVAERQHRLISLEKFEEECQSAGIKSDPALFLEFLHNAGEVFWRRGLFQNRIILDQAWMLDAVYALLHRDNCVARLRENHGRFTQGLLGALHWDHEKYSPDEQNLFLGFMVECGIVFRLGGHAGDQRYIAPDFLPEQFDGREKWDFEPTEEIKLDYEALPPPLITRVIARIGALAGAEPDYWRHGLFFYERETRSRVLFEASCGDEWSGHIMIGASGGDAARAIERVREILHEEEARLQVKPNVELKTSTEDEGKLAPGPDPAKPTTYYISYAWDEKDTADAGSREKIVDQLCTEAASRGIEVIRDKTSMSLGDRISEFMMRLSRGDRIVVILSDKYLKSRFCMEELYEVWMRSRNDGDEFNQKVRMFIQDDADLWTPVARAKLARFWREEYDQEKEFLEDMGAVDRANHDKLRRFYAHVGEITQVTADTLQPRSLDELIDYTFA